MTHDWQKEPVNPAAESLWVSTSNRGFAVYGLEEWRRRFPAARGAYLEPAEVLLVRVPEPEEAVRERMSREEPIFVRHIHPVQRVLDAADGTLEQLAVRIAGDWPLFGGTRVALQVRRSAGKAGNPKGLQDTDRVSTGEGEGADSGIAGEKSLRELVGDQLAALYGVNLVPKDAEWVLSVYQTDDLIYCGLSRPNDNLSDWAGGAIRFKREEGQLSRAKFKLLEAEVRFGLDLARYRSALDVGAAPGGWTSLLLERGLRVTAVDPAALHESLLGNPRLTVLRANASDVRLHTGEFDLLVCDMSWSPRQMRSLVAELLHAVKPGGLVIMTLKLMHGKPFQTLRETREAFAETLEELAAKQLFHNRDEFTMIFQKR